MRDLQQLALRIKSEPSIYRDIFIELFHDHSDELASSSIIHKKFEKQMKMKTLFILQNIFRFQKDKFFQGEEQKTLVVEIVKKTLDVLKSSACKRAVLNEFLRAIPLSIVTVREFLVVAFKHPDGMNKEFLNRLSNFVMQFFKNPCNVQSKKEVLDILIEKYKTVSDESNSVLLDKIRSLSYLLIMKLGNSLAASGEGGKYKPEIEQLLVDGLFIDNVKLRKLSLLYFLNKTDNNFVVSRISDRIGFIKKLITNIRSSVIDIEEKTMKFEILSMLLFGYPEGSRFVITVVKMILSIITVNEEHSNRLLLIIVHLSTLDNIKIIIDTVKNELLNTTEDDSVVCGLSLLKELYIFIGSKYEKLDVKENIEFAQFSEPEDLSCRDSSSTSFSEESLMTENDEVLDDHSVSHSRFFAETKPLFTDLIEYFRQNYPHYCSNRSKAGGVYNAYNSLKMVVHLGKGKSSALLGFVKNKMTNELRRQKKQEISKMKYQDAKRFLINEKDVSKRERMKNRNKKGRKYYSGCSTKNSLNKN